MKYYKINITVYINVQFPIKYWRSIDRTSVVHSQELGVMDFPVATLHKTFLSNGYIFVTFAKIWSGNIKD
jgi:hypothetical protein